MDAQANNSFTRQVLARLQERNLVLPQSLPAPAGLYEPFRLHNGLGFLAAQVPGYDRKDVSGRVGIELTPEQGKRAAMLAGLNALARIYQALNGFDDLIGLLHVAGHVASADTFQDQPSILDGASELFVAVLAERGRHTRTAYAPSQLPRGISIELEITFAYSNS